MKARSFDFEVPVKIEKVITTDGFDDSIDLTDDSNTEVTAEVEVVFKSSFFNALLLTDTGVSDLGKGSLAGFHRRIASACSLSRILDKLGVRSTSDSDSDINYFSEETCGRRLSLHWVRYCQGDLF